MQYNCIVLAILQTIFAAISVTQCNYKLLTLYNLLIKLYCEKKEARKMFPKYLFLLEKKRA